MTSSSVPLFLALSFPPPLTLSLARSVSLSLWLSRSLSRLLTPSLARTTNKISLGLPIGILNTSSAIYTDWPQYFNNIIIDNINNPYMLNVYGNINISSIYGKPIIKFIVDNGKTINQSLEKVSIGIGGEPNI